MPPLWLLSRAASANRQGASSLRQAQALNHEAGEERMSYNYILNAAAVMEEFTEGRLECTVDSPQKENEGTKDVYISYLITTTSDYPSFHKPTFSVRRRFTDFLFLYKILIREFPAVAVPPIPDKHKLEYVRGDRFGPDFTSRRAHSLHRFLKRLALHPELRRAPLLMIFLESADWNAQMKGRQTRGDSLSEGNGSSGASSPGTAAGGGVFENLTDTLMGAFSKVHKPDKRFISVRERADKLEDDLAQVEKIVARVGRRQTDLETDYADLATQFQKLMTMEPGAAEPLTAFASSVTNTSHGWKGLRETTENDYLGSLRDMAAYVGAVRSLLKARDQKQVDFEELTAYLAKAASDRDNLASSSNSYVTTSPLGSASGFLRSKIEDVRGIDHESARMERLRKLEMKIGSLTQEVEHARFATEQFDEQTVVEVARFEGVKSEEFKDTLGALADAHIKYFTDTAEEWEAFVERMEKEGMSGEAVDVQS